MASKKATKEPGKLTKAYLLFYNTAQFLGWSYILYLTVHYYYKHEKSRLWDKVNIFVSIFQNAAVLEIFHAAFRLVSSNVMITTFQVFSRVMLVCGILLPIQLAQESPGLMLLLVAWSVTEIIRYLFYALNIINRVPRLLVWCRYTFFIILYPVGVTGELLCLYSGWISTSESEMWTIKMPNSLNFTFNYAYFILIVMCLYPPLFPQMYLHMFAQRRKIFGSQRTEKSR